MVVECTLKIDIEKLKTDGKNYMPVQFGPSEPVFGWVKGIVKELGNGIYRCNVEIYPEHEKYVMDKREDELKIAP